MLFDVDGTLTDTTYLHTLAWWRALGDGGHEVAIRPLPGARSLVRDVSRRGATVVLATSAKQRDIDDLLRALDLGDAIDHVVHAADVESAKPAPDIFAAALDAAGCAPEQAVVVGDTVWDVEAAAKAGLATIAVQTGGHGRAELLEAGAVAVFRDAAALLADLDRSPIGRLLGT